MSNPDKRELDCISCKVRLTGQVTYVRHLMDQHCYGMLSAKGIWERYFPVPPVDLRPYDPAVPTLEARIDKMEKMYRGQVDKSAENVFARLDMVDEIKRRQADVLVLLEAIETAFTQTETYMAEVYEKDIRDAASKVTKWLDDETWPRDIPEARG